MVHTKGHETKVKQIRKYYRHKQAGCRRKNADQSDSSSLRGLGKARHDVVCIRIRLLKFSQRNFDIIK